MFYTVKRLVSLLLLFLRFRPSDQTQSIADCPPSWFQSSGLCYNFVFQPEKTYQEALLHCQQDMAQLVSIKTAGQHEFIQTWLKTHDAAGRDWFTSGIKERSGHFVWNSDGSNVTDTYFGDHEIVDKIKIDIWTRLENNVVVYKYFATVDQYMWGWNRVMKPGAFICQIEQTETWRFYQQQRDFSYGSTSSNPTAWEFAPNITYISQDTIFFETRGQTTDVTLECLASGNPIPQYRWFRKSLSRGVQEWMDPQINPKITLSYGKLIIRNPDPVTDSSTYTCVASNKLGTVWSNPVDVGFGYIGQFSNVKTNFIDAVLYMGIEIGCDTPVHNTDLHYAWYKSDMIFIRPELNSQYFLSKNGKFYISEVQSSDQGEYFCVVMMVPRSGQVLTETQAPSRTSLGIDLRVLGGTAHTYGPEIMDKFPQFFPEVPMVGDYVELECFAYGRMPLYYSWLREDGPLHPQAFYRDYKRVLVIPKARLQDTGSYTCIVKGDKNSSNKTLHLSLKSQPYFPYPMRNQHLDAGMSFTWICGAIGYPLPMYTWYKNGVMLTSDSGDGIKVHRNTLTISNVTLGRHEGVYQCEAVNVYGKARSGGQLRILYFAPTFATSAIETSKSAAEGGNVTIACSPHAAPRATIKWLRNGAEIGHFLPNGALELSSLKKSDEGVYTCVASNELGEASSTCRLFVEENAVFVEQPIDVTVEENETTVIPCKVSFVPGKMDIVYSWRFYSHVIDFTSISEDRVHYTTPYANTLDNGALYIVSAQIKHTGLYTCVVTTVTGSISASGYLIVKGPPGEPGGVHAKQNNDSSIFHTNVDIWWQDGEDHGYPVTRYKIEYLSIYEEEWQVLRDDIPVHLTTIESHPTWHGFKVVDGLSPGNAYMFRVSAGNDQVGYGHPNQGPTRTINKGMTPTSPLLLLLNVYTPQELSPFLSAMVLGRSMRDQSLQKA